MERAVGIPMGSMAGLFVGLGTIFVGTIGVPPGAPNGCVGLMAAAGMTTPRASTT